MQNPQKVKIKKNTKALEEDINEQNITQQIFHAGV